MRASHSKQRFLAGYDDKASTKKILQQKLLCSVTTSSTLGFRMCGMQVRCQRHVVRYSSCVCGRSLVTRAQYWQNEQRSYVVRDKLWGCKLKENTMQVCINASLRATPHQHADCTFRARWCNFWTTGTVFDSL